MSGANYSAMKVQGEVWIFLGWFSKPNILDWCSYSASSPRPLPIRSDRAAGSSLHK